MAESEVLRIPFMEIQPNWDEVITGTQAGKFWVSCKSPGEKTVHGELSPGKYPTGGKFIISDIGKRTVTVECPQAQSTTTFVRPLKTLQVHSSPLVCMDVSSSGALGVCGGAGGALWIWDTDTGETRRTLEGHVGDVYTCQFFPSGIVVVSGGADLQLKIWSAQDGSCPRTLTGHTRGITDTAIIDRGRNIVSVSGDGTARLWDCGTGTCLDTIAELSCPINSCSLRQSPVMAEQSLDTPPEPECGTSGKLLLLACENGTLSAWDIRHRKQVMSYGGGGASVNSCSFLTDTTAVLGREDGQLSCLDLRNTDQPIAQSVSFGSSGVTSLLPVAEDKCLASYKDGSCVVWERSKPASGLWRLTGPQLDAVTAVRRAGDNIFTSCRDGRVRVYTCKDLS